ncbi:MAG: hypothetical protein U9N72_12010 [Bacteroidota bacterium]|nr:hypothetical protein [Bacteroidota bacterium]
MRWRTTRTPTPAVTNKKWNIGTEDPEFAIASEGEELDESLRQQGESIMEWWNNGIGTLNKLFE